MLLKRSKKKEKTFFFFPHFLKTLILNKSSSTYRTQGRTQKVIADICLLGGSTRTSLKLFYLNIL